MRQGHWYRLKMIVWLHGLWAAIVIDVTKKYSALQVWCLGGTEWTDGGRPRSEVQSSVLRFAGLVEWSAVGPAEWSLRSEDWRTADTAGMGGREQVMNKIENAPSMLPCGSSGRLICFCQYSGNPMNLTLTIGYFCSNDLNCSRKWWLKKIAVTRSSNHGTNIYGFSGGFLDSNWSLCCFFWFLGLFFLVELFFK